MNEPRVLTSEELEGVSPAMARAMESLQVLRENAGPELRVKLDCDGLLAFGADLNQDKAMAIALRGLADAFERRGLSGESAPAQNESPG